MADHPLDRRRFEQLAAIFEPAAQRSAIVDQLQHQVGSRDARVGIDGARRQVLERERLRRLLQDEHHPEQRVAVQPARQTQRAQELLDRQLLVAIGLQRHVADPLQHFAEGRIAGQIGPQHDRVGEHADQPFDLQLTAIGDQRAHGDVMMVGVAAEQALKRAQQCHEQAGMVGAAEAAQPLRQLCRQTNRDAGAAAGPLLGPRPVGSQRQFRQALQPAAPMAQLRLGRRRGEPRALPLHEVPILLRQLVEAARLPVAIAIVESFELVEEQPVRPTIGDQMMQLDQEDMLLITELQKLDVHRRGGLDLERGPQQVEHVSLDGRHLPGLRDGAKIAPLDRRVPGGYRLPYLSLLVGKDRTQRLVAVADRGDAGVERTDVERAGQHESRDHVVSGWIGIDRGEQMDALLLERQGAALLRSAGRLQALRTRMVSQHLDTFSQRGHRRRVENVLERDLGVIARPEAGDQLGDRERIRAERKDVLIHTDFIEPEQVGPHAGELPLGFGARRHQLSAAMDVRAWRRDRQLAGQLTANNPAVGVFRESCDDADQAGDLEPRQPLAGEAPELLDVDLVLRPRNNRGGDVLTEPRMRNRKHHRFGHVGVAHQGILHLPRRDLLSTAIDDVGLVDAAEQEEIAIGVEVTEIAGPEPAVAERCACRGLVLVVAAGDRGPLEHDLAALPGREHAALVIHDRDGGAGGLADRAGLAPFEGIGSDLACGFGHAIGLDDGNAEQAFQLVEDAGGQRRGCGSDQPQAGLDGVLAPVRRCDQRAVDRRHGRVPAGLERRQPIQERRGVEFRRTDHARSRCKRRQQAGDQTVRMHQRLDVDQPVVRRERQSNARAIGRVANAGLCQRHQLRLRRAAGCQEHEGVVRRLRHVAGYGRPRRRAGEIEGSDRRVGAE